MSNVWSHSQKKNSWRSTKSKNLLISNASNITQETQAEPKVCYCNRARGTSVR